jgi:phospholipid/cholesterol/gamma-HCH transport system permease protein
LKSAKNLTLDFSQVEDHDTYLLVFIKAINDLCMNKDLKLITRGFSDDMNSFIYVLSEKTHAIPVIKASEPFWKTYFTNVGEIAIILFQDTRYLIEFLGELTTKMLFLLFHPKQTRLKDFSYHFTHAGVDALPIVILIVFLIGVISGYQGAVQLHQFGADIYIADLIGISITRELGPLMAAILVAGRSGSAFAAEIGTMKVSEEIDALTSMGFDKIRFLVLPRVLAIVCAMPFLVVIADVAGIAGGYLSAATSLNITLTGYMNELRTAISYSDILSGLWKSVVFGYLVGTVGCFRGMQVRGGAESVGKYTTSSVVSGILLIIIADGIFTFFFKALGI